MEQLTLKDIAIINMGQSPDSKTYNEEMDGVPFYQGKSDFGKINPIPRVWCSAPIKIAERNDILISVRAPIGDTNIATEKCCIGRGLASIRPIDESINLKYLYYLINSKYNELNKFGTGSTFKAITKDNLCNLKCNNMPDIEEQTIIANILDNVSQIIEIKKEQIENLNTIIKSQFVEMFGKNNEVEYKKIVDICKSIVRGPFGSALKKEFFVEKNANTYKVYEQKNAINENWKLGTYYINEQKHNELKRFECKPKDIIMSCSGTIGRFYQFPEDMEKGIINQALLKFTINEEIVLSQYFMDYMKMNVTSLDTKGSGLQNLGSVSYIKEMDIPVPNIDLQKRYLDFVKQVDKQKFESEIELRKIQKNIFYKWGR